MSRTEDEQPTSPYQAMERETPEEHPIDATVERRIPQRKIRRRMREAGERLMYALGERRALWMRLEELLGLYHSRREETYFNLGYDHGIAAGRVEGLRALLPDIGIRRNWDRAASGTGAAAGAGGGLGLGGVA